MTFHGVVETLEKSFAAPLPGASAQALMAPRPAPQPPAGVTPARIRHAAGLLVVYPVGSDAHIVLTVRADTLRHPGQVSLPGGVVEAGETFEQAALREAHEEIALAADTVRVLGALTPIDIVVSGFRLHPIVAAAEVEPCLHPADGEVARILYLDVASLMRPSSVARRPLEREGRVYDVPAFRSGGAEVWGATAMVLAEFLVLLGWEGPALGTGDRSNLR